MGEAGLPGWDSSAVYLESVEEELFLLVRPGGGGVGDGGGVEH